LRDRHDSAVWAPGFEPFAVQAAKVATIVGQYDPSYGGCIMSCCSSEAPN
jgi:hypothetical protein